MRSTLPFAEVTHLHCAICTSTKGLDRDTWNPSGDARRNDDVRYPAAYDGPAFPWLLPARSTP